jgi:hypothetical protein
VSDKQSPKLDADRRRHVLDKEQRGGFGVVDRDHHAYATPRAIDVLDGGAGFRRDFHARFLLTRGSAAVLLTKPSRCSM